MDYKKMFDTAFSQLEGSYRSPGNKEFCDIVRERAKNMDKEAITKMNIVEIEVPEISRAEKAKHIAFRAAGITLSAAAAVAVIFGVGALLRINAPEPEMHPYANGAALTGESQPPAAATAPGAYTNFAETFVFDTGSDSPAVTTSIDWKQYEAVPEELDSTNERVFEFEKCTAEILFWQFDGQKAVITYAVYWKDKITYSGESGKPVGVVLSPAGFGGTGSSGSMANELVSIEGNTVIYRQTVTTDEWVPEMSFSVDCEPYYVAALDTYIDEHEWNKPLFDDKSFTITDWRKELPQEIS